MLERKIAALSKHGTMTRRLRPMPGVGPSAPSLWKPSRPPWKRSNAAGFLRLACGLVPLQSTGGKKR